MVTLTHRKNAFPLKRLSEKQTSFALITDHYLQCCKIWEAPVYHRMMKAMVCENLISQKKLSDWLCDTVHAEAGTIGNIRKKHSRFFEEAEHQAKQWQNDGLGVCVSDDTYADSLPCAQVFFWHGTWIDDIPHIAVFNSRKPRNFKPDAPWLNFIRNYLPTLCTENMGIASGWDTMTYELVTLYARELRKKILAVIISPLYRFPRISPYFPFFAPGEITAVSCQSQSIRCPKPTRMLCRDRLLALLSDIHMIAEIRKDGNLHTILEDVQVRHPKEQQIFLPSKQTDRNNGNFALLEKFPEHSRAVSGEFALQKPSHRPKIAKTCALKILKKEKIPWNQYLFHYTRSFPADAYPGQTYEDYIVSLLNEEPLSEHTAIDTLIRILNLKIIRVGFGLVRGNLGAVSWTSVPPIELHNIRRWNPALIRWTFEPYGIAIKRKILIEMNCKPVIYIPAKDYGKVKHDDRFRFQLHDPPQCNWKCEREWRLADNFSLNQIGEKDGFIFVNSEDDLARLTCLDNCPLPVVVVSDDINERK